jgi:hypothetical protein
LLFGSFQIIAASTGNFTSPLLDRRRPDCPSPVRQVAATANIDAIFIFYDIDDVEAGGTQHRFGTGALGAHQLVQSCAY